MDILFLADPIDNQTAGVHFYTKRLVQALLKVDHENKYTFIHQKSNELFKDTRHYIIPSKHGFGRDTLRKFIKIPQLIKELKPDIVIEPCHIGPFNIPKNIKKVTIIHDITPILFPKFHIRKSVIIHKLLLPRIIKNADLVITPSQNTKSDIEKIYKKDPNKIAIIPEGCDKPNLSIHRSFFTGLEDPKMPYILYIGTIEPRKNLSTLVDAFLELKSKNNLPHKLVLGGSIGWKIADLLEKIKQHSKDIILTGYLTEEDKAALYKHADMFIYPSFYEGFGLPPLEAMSYGIPVICSNGGSLKEIFEKHALMFNPEDKEKLKTHIMNLALNKEKSKLKEACDFAQTFTWEQTAKEFIKAISSIN